MKRALLVLALLAAAGCAHKRTAKVDIPDFSVVVSGRCIEKLSATPDTYCRAYGGEFTCYRIMPLLKPDCGQEEWTKVGDVK